MAILGTHDDSAPSIEDMELMKEKFAKLLLGEDMSGGGKGVSSALALSNAITNLGAAVFAEQKRLEPMAPEMKARWRKEVDWLLSITDHIVEFVASKQKSPDGSTMDVMITRQRADLLMNIPALRKLDAMLIECLDNFKDANEFSYKSNNDKGGNNRKDDKWWIPTPQVPADGLSDATRKWLQCQKDTVNQVLKAAMAINAQVLAEIDIPDNYIENLPKKGRASLGDSIYKSITDDYFDPDDLLSSVDLSSEHKIVDLMNRIEASIVIWRRKMNAKDSKSSWGSAVSIGKRELFEERAQTILLILKQRFPGLPQSQLDVSKIQFNQDVGQAILESYSRTIETMAFTVLSRIEDVIQADTSARNPSYPAKRFSLKENSTVSEQSPNAREEVEKLNASEVPSSMKFASEVPSSMKFSDFMGWATDQSQLNVKKDYEFPKEGNFKSLKPPPSIITNRRMSYLENLGVTRSPTARH